MSNRQPELVTISTSDPQIRKYLFGDFSPNKIAMPLSSLNIQNSTITFQIEEFLPMNFFMQIFILFKTVKTQDLILVFFPLVLLLLKNLVANKTVFILNLILCFFGILFLIFAMRLRNIYLDHLRGLDRLNPESVESPLMQGKVKALALKQLSKNFLGAAVLFSLPLIWSNFSLLLIVLPAVALGLYAQFFHLSYFKEKPAGEVLVFILFGPLYISGLEISLIGQIGLDNLVMGFCIGMMSMLLLNLRVFANFLFLSEVRSQNTLVKIGFDRSKKYLFLMLTFSVGSFLVYHLFYMGNLWFALSLTVSVICSALYLRYFKSCTSPAGSDSLKLKIKLTEFIYVLYILWIVEYVWLMLFKTV